MGEKPYRFAIVIFIHRSQGIYLILIFSSCWFRFSSMFHIVPSLTQTLNLICINRHELILSFLRSNITPLESGLFLKVLSLKENPLLPYSPNSSNWYLLLSSCGWFNLRPNSSQESRIPRQTQQHSSGLKATTTLAFYVQIAVTAFETESTIWGFVMARVTMLLRLYFWTSCINLYQDCSLLWPNMTAI